jgi:hypothetical protein
VKVTLHFVAKPGRAADVESRLRQLGFAEVRILPGADRVVLRAEPEEIEERLGVALESGSRQRKVGPVTKRVPTSDIPESARLPAALDEVVDRWYLPEPPDRLGR